jgi:hypothetical protein
MAIKLDLNELKAAADMWVSCVRLHALKMAENQREALRELYSFDL